MPNMKVTPNGISYNAAISACEKTGQWQLALSLLSSMPKMKVTPDGISYNAAISACEKGGQWQLALSLLNSLQQTTSATLVTLHAVLHTARPDRNGTVP